ncbi:hypothetical protein RHAL1_00642 [Beijerinckiaceae bacterium RH AL1]|nr:DUF992 domain-containing protein [Beijerinckiaceae bacterium]VVB43276.1 hypothetical protein RHAL8_00611 [Beijerinckiaceae bacterium RH AL8]VVB43291.1 hypothetical protein RHCH11_RHCH11_00613 [Beijerinckiaceae bacterium RH CH11]VVC53759.1 hypothetical protein RHAL1_00642 [Beijerinckiaceae bacterium RH AL1]
MRPFRLVLLAGAAALQIAVALPALAQGGSSELRCTQAGGIGFVITSNRKVTCTYYRQDGAVEFYTGVFDRVGLDAGPTNPVRLAFLVSVPGPITTGALDGSFGGAGVQVTLGSGIGADALIGGATGRAILTPVQNLSLTGLNVNGGLGVLRLAYRGMERSRYR